MSISLLLEMAVSANPAKIAVVEGEHRMTVGELSDLVDRGAGLLKASRAEHVGYVGVGGLMLPLLIFAAARAGIPFTPINYRLSADGVQTLIDRLPNPIVIVDARYRNMIANPPGVVVDSARFFADAAVARSGAVLPDPESAAVVLFTSGTTSQPKAVELSHNNLTSYVTGTVEFDSASAEDAALICVPPYHIAGVSTALSNLYAGRKMVYLTNFDAHEWVRLVEAENITTATVVPTMLSRIVDVLEGSHARLPSLRNLAYGGSKVGMPVVRRAIDLLPHVGFVNAYGLTETSSTVAVLTPEDHRTAYQAAQRGGDPAVAKRLGSVGRAVPGVEVEVRDDLGNVAAPGITGELFVRGEQVSGRYAGVGSVLDTKGWFATRDVAMLDAEGYLFIGGRSDDTIIRGGENVAPAEIEDVLIEHPDVRQVAVVGVDDPQWGQAIVAVVVAAAACTPKPAELLAYVRDQLRGSRTPDRVVFRDELPTSATGKILRRQIVDELHGVTPTPMLANHPR